MQTAETLTVTSNAECNGIRTHLTVDQSKLPTGWHFGCGTKVNIKLQLKD